MRTYAPLLPTLNDRRGIIVVDRERDRRETDLIDVVGCAEHSCAQSIVFDGVASLAHLVRAQDAGHSIQFAPGFSDVRAKSEA